MHLREVVPIKDPLVNYIVLSLAFLFEGTSWLVSLRQFRTSKRSFGYYEAFRRSKDPATFIVLFEDSAALAGIVIAAVGTFMATTMGIPIFDGIASLLIGLVLAGTASLLARESKSLLLGERADSALSDSILRIAAHENSVLRANGVLTIQLAPDQILAALSLEFADNLQTSEIEKSVVDIEREVRKIHPEVVTLFVKPQTELAYKETVRRRFSRPTSGQSLD